MLLGTFRIALCYWYLKNVFHCQENVHVEEDRIREQLVENNTSSESDVESYHSSVEESAHATENSEFVLCPLVFGKLLNLNVEDDTIRDNLSSESGVDSYHSKNKPLNISAHATEKLEFVSGTCNVPCYRGVVYIYLVRIRVESIQSRKKARSRMMLEASKI